MKNNALIMCNSNFFNIVMQTSLKPYFNDSVLHFRYPNEEMDENEHFIQQIQLLFDHQLYMEGKLFTFYEFSFNNHLAFRIDRLFSHFHPSILFYEWRTNSDTEWLVLEYIYMKYHIPVVVYIPNSLFQEKMMKRMLSLGVREVFHHLEFDIVDTIAKRQSNSLINK